METIQKILEKISIPPLRECGQKLENKMYRLKSYLYMLKQANWTNNAEETLELINNTLIHIEDCHSGVPVNPSPSLQYDGRMYPIQEDNVDRQKGGRIIAITKGNKVIIEPSGEFQILNKLDDSIILDKRHEN